MTGLLEPLTSAEIPKIQAIGVWDTVGKTSHIALAYT
jgi:hypothetical protein